jgi:NitT/TauT family transport system substrate-binding protein
MITRKLLLGAFALLAIVTVAFVAWSFQPKQPSTGKPITLQQEWFPYAGYAGEVEARRLAAKDGVEIKIQPGSESVDPIKLVLSGSVDFGVAGADLVITANAKGADLVCIGVVSNISPTCFIVRPDSRIKSPDDFIGKKVGILPGTNTERVYNLMMKRSGVDRSRVTEVPVPFDLQTFVLQQYDVRPAFIYDEPISLTDKEISFAIIKPSDYGVNFIGNVYFTRRDVIKTKPEQVKVLVKYLILGWDAAVSNPRAAVETLASEFDGIDKSRELRALEAGIDYFKGPRGALSSSEANWRETISGLEELGEIPSGAVSLKSVLDDSFLNAATEK